MVSHIQQLRKRTSLSHRFPYSLPPAKSCDGEPAPNLELPGGAAMFSELVLLLLP